MPRTDARSAWFDPDHGIIRAAASGMWSPARMDAHFHLLRPLVERMRAEAGRALVLVDLTRAPVQGAETAATLNGWTERLYRPEDCVAIVSASALLRLQMKHGAKAFALSFFGTVDDALAWLRDR